MTVNPPTLRLFLCCLLLWAGGMATPLQAAERRVALVIGNANYADKPLRNPVHDAADLAAALRRMGFEVMERKDRTADQLRGDLSDFQDKLSPGAVGLFYFAGHGVQAGRGQNYLLPVGVSYKRERDAESYGLEVGSVLRRMEDAGTALSLVILDACRDSPLPPEGRSTASRGLGRMEAPSGSMIAFATAPGSIADENALGRNGLYTQHLLAAIESPGVRLEDVFKRVRRGVEKDSNRRQSPEEIMKLTSDEPFYFKAGNATQVASVVSEPARPSAAQLEQQAWDAAQSAGTAAALQAYVAEYPRGAYVGVARVRLAALARPVQPEAVPQPAAVPAPAPVQNTARQPFEPEMVRLPAGSFTMGSPASEVGRSADEGPQRRVNIAAFELAKTEVTQGQWKAVMGSNPSRFSECGDTCPVEQVSWDDIQQYLQKLNQMTGQRYRLPSEAEWEYAARAGCESAFNVGGQCAQKIEASQANFRGSSTYNGSAKSEFRSKTTPVGSFQANTWGLYDMYGNAEEWVQDVWHDNYNGAPTDGSAWVSGGEQNLRVLRGGSWFGIPRSLRSADRSGNTPASRADDLGFRLARTVP